ncbi:MAG: N-acetylglucosamine kinase [Bacteroidia bacterium]
MILIADSGSTKTDWRLIDENRQIHQFSTQGINPYFQGSDEIAEQVIKARLFPQMHNVMKEAKADEIFFYGAGCRAEEKRQIVRDALLKKFPAAVVTVETDMLGAARALCGSHKGIAAILGTGMNSCLYDGKNIVANTASLGYVLGDEGSGAHLGKTFISAYLNGEVPPELSKRFEERFKLTRDLILDAVYKQPFPNRFLASFSKFIYQNLKEQFIIDMVAACFESFFDKHVCRFEDYRQHQLSCTGSVAFYYSNIFRAVAAKKGVAVKTIVESPIAGLTLYHLGE